MVSTTKECFRRKENGTFLSMLINAYVVKTKFANPKPKLIHSALSCAFLGASSSVSGSWLPISIAPLNIVEERNARMLICWLSV